MKYRVHYFESKSKIQRKQWLSTSEKSQVIRVYWQGDHFWFLDFEVVIMIYKLEEKKYGQYSSTRNKTTEGNDLVKMQRDAEYYCAVE